MELFEQSLDRGVYHLPNPDEDGRVYVYAVDSSGTLVVPPEPVDEAGYRDATARAWRYLEDVDPRGAAS